MSRYYLVCTDCDNKASGNCADARCGRCCSDLTTCNNVYASNCSYHNNFNCKNFRNCRNRESSESLENGQCWRCRPKNCKYCSNKASKKCPNNSCADCCKIYQFFEADCMIHDTGCCRSCKSTGTRSFWVDGTCKRCRNLPDPARQVVVKEVIVEKIVEKVIVKEPKEWKKIQSVFESWKSNDPWSTCVVCLDKEASSALIPCGHIFCSICCNRVTSCPKCRKTKTSTLKLYQ